MEGREQLFSPLSPANRCLQTALHTCSCLARRTTVPEETTSNAKAVDVRARGGRICDPDQKTARTRHCQCCQKADQQLPGTGEPAIVLGSKMPVATPRKDCTLRCHGAGAMAKFYGSAAEPIARERQATQPLCRCRSLLCDHRLDHVRACDAGQLCTAV